MQVKQKVGASVTLWVLSRLTLPELGAVPGGPSKMRRA